MLKQAGGRINVRVAGQPTGAVLPDFDIKTAFGPSYAAGPTDNHFAPFVVRAGNLITGKNPASARPAAETATLACVPGVKRP